MVLCGTKNGCITVKNLLNTFIFKSEIEVNSKSAARGNKQVVNINWLTF